MLRLLLVMCFPSILCSQHTFSIVAIDTVTGEIGSAGATCLDTIMLNGGEGALVISDIILGIGAIHTQAWWYPENQKAARDRMELGETPAEIMNWLIQNDNPSDGHTIDDRQYGVIALVNGKPQAVAYTGINNQAFADHVTGWNYSIQGNILSGSEVLQDMKRSFLITKGSLADKLMAAMQGAKRIGADSRCREHGVSSLSAFLRVAHPEDSNSSYGRLSLDINIPATPDGVDPIDELQKAFEQWQDTDKDH